MSESEARDAYVGVEVPLPNGKTVTGKPVPYRDGMRLLVLSEAFLAGGAPTDTLVPMLAQFEQLTGITGEKLETLCPGISLGEVLDVAQRFFYWRRTAPIVVPQNPSPSNPAPSPSPSGA